MKYCPTCDAERSSEQVDELGWCVVCGTPVEDQRTEAGPEIPTLPATEVRSEPTEPEEPPSEIETAQPTTASRQEEDETLAEVEEEPLEKEQLDYEGVSTEVEENIREGYKLFGLVGGPASGKTHALKALHYLLQTTGTQSEQATFEFLQAPVPGPTGIKVGYYDYEGPTGKWTFVDAGGELYSSLRNNEWRFGESSVRLSRWLHRCHGLFCFLHLRPGHFGGHALDIDPALAEDPTERERLERDRREARRDQEELSLFRYFFLFIRALRAEDGDVGKVIEICRAAPSLEDALHPYARSTPLLDIPVMFFFTQADLYDREEVPVGTTHLKPRLLNRSVAAFTAKHLPTLFASVSTQVRRFKFDFLQSYEEAETGKFLESGEPEVATFWHAPGEPRSLLSIGLLSGLEFILRNQPRKRRPWALPQITTRQALWLHRRLHPADWEGVSGKVLGSWRRPGETP